MSYIETGFASLALQAQQPKDLTVKPVVRTPDLDAEFPLSPLQKLAIQRGTPAAGSSILDKFGAFGKDLLGRLLGGSSTGVTQTPQGPVYMPAASNPLQPFIMPALVVGGAAALYFLVLKKKGRR